MRIGLMGGSFNPVHIAHISAAIQVKDALLLDKIILIPAYVSPFKTDKRQVSGEHRYNMLCIATKEYDFFEISSFEIDSGGVSYTYITTEHYRSLYPDDEIYFIMGDEAYAQFDKWKYPDRIRSAAQICVVTRDGSNVLGAVYVNIPPMPVSSTEIREKIARGESADGILHPEVYEYIKKHNLYEG